MGRHIVLFYTTICFSLWTNWRWITNEPLNMIMTLNIGRLIGWIEMELSDLNGLSFHRIWTSMGWDRMTDEETATNELKESLTRVWKAVEKESLEKIGRFTSEWSNSYETRTLQDINLIERSIFSHLKYRFCLLLGQFLREKISNFFAFF